MVRQPVAGSNPAVKSKRPPKRPSEYALQVRELSKIRDAYHLRKKQLSVYARLLRKSKEGAALLPLLELRLENVVYRSGAVTTRRAARQKIRHAAVKVNGRIVTIPSLALKVGDKLIISKVQFSEETAVPAWLRLHRTKNEVLVVRAPEAAEVEPDIDETLILEYYSKR